MRTVITWGSGILVGIVLFLCWSFLLGPFVLYTLGIPPLVWYINSAFAGWIIFSIGQITYYLLDDHLPHFDKED